MSYTLHSTSKYFYEWVMFDDAFIEDKLKQTLLSKPVVAAFKICESILHHKSFRFYFERITVSDIDKLLDTWIEILTKGGIK